MRPHQRHPGHRGWILPEPVDGRTFDAPPIDLEARPILRRVTAARAALGGLREAARRMEGDTDESRALRETFGMVEARASCALDGIDVRLEDALIGPLVSRGYERFTHVDEVCSDERAAGTLASRSWASRTWSRDSASDARRAESPASAFIDRLAVNLSPSRRNVVRRYTRMKEPETPSLVTDDPPLGERRIRSDLARLLAWSEPSEPSRAPLGVDREAGLDPLLTMAVLHARVQEIHPYRHANGRLARLLSTLHLVRHGVLAVPVLGLHHWLSDHRGEYHAHLRAVCEKQAWEPWLTFLLTGVEASARGLTERLRGRERLQDETLLALTAGGAEGPLAGMRGRPELLVELIFRYPCVNVRHLVEAGLARRQTAGRYLRTLAGTGLLTPRSHGTEMYYCNVPLLDLLEAPYGTSRQGDGALPSPHWSISRPPIDEAENRS